MHPERLTSATATNNVLAARKTRHFRGLRLRQHQSAVARTRIVQASCGPRDVPRRKTTHRRQGASRLLERLPAWVATLTPNGTAAALTSNAEAGTVHVAFAGAPAHAMETFPLNPFTGAAERL